MGIKRWSISAPDGEKVRELAREAGIPELTAGLLISRGADSAEEAERFFSAEEPLEDPFSLLDMDRAAERLRRSVDDGERICVYGDYDCDGITSVLLLSHYLESVGADVSCYIPSREEGYGLNARAVEALAGKGVGLIVTVDNGISAAKEVDLASRLGMDVIVTDHHQPPEQLPRAAAVVDPHRAGCPSAFKELAGVGVAFKLVCAMEDDREGEMLEYYADWAALGTVADVVSLTGENRRIVRRGLEMLPHAENIGLRALLRACGLEDKPLKAENIAFMLAPRINAASRMGQLDRVMELFACEEEEQADLLAEQLCACNSARQKEEQKILDGAARAIAGDPSVLYDRVLVLSGEEWHHGVVGIVCSRLTERYGKPCLLISTSGEEGRGSGRSVPGFSLIEAVSRCRGLLSKYGGHPAAVGFSLPAGQVPAFRKAVNEAAAEISRDMPVPRLNIDRAVSPAELTVENLRFLEQMEPFGAGNEEPVFALLACRVEGAYSMGEGKHLRLRLSRDGASFYAVWFGMPAQNFLYSPGDIVDLAVSCGVSLWQGEERVTIRIKDLRPSGLDQEALIDGWRDYDRYRRGEGLSSAASAPNRDKIAHVYRGLRGMSAPFGDYIQLFGRIQCAGVNYCAVRLAVEVLSERGLIRLGKTQAGLAARLVPSSGKVDLEASPVMERLKSLKTIK